MNKKNPKIIAYLCAMCAKEYADFYNVQELKRDISEKGTCEDCGRSCFGAKYEITKRKSG